jgi:hypothetical protein
MKRTPSEYPDGGLHRAVSATDVTWPGGAGDGRCV